MQRGRRRNASHDTDGNAHRRADGHTYRDGYPQAHGNADGLTEADGNADGRYANADAHTDERRSGLYVSDK